MQDLRFLYDAWNVIAEFDASPTVPAAQSPRLAVSYAWGPDLSGTTTGAGGVGGLVSATEYDAAGNAVQMLAPAYDTNGNVVAYADIATGVLTHRFEYDAFGIALTVSYSDNSEAPPFRFSTKYHDAETGLSYYGSRYYSPELGRWVNRDPIGEDGGVNLYGMVGNDPVNQWDGLGNKPGTRLTKAEAKSLRCALDWYLSSLTVRAVGYFNGWYWSPRLLYRYLENTGRAYSIPYSAIANETIVIRENEKAQKALADWTNGYHQGNVQTAGDHDLQNSLNGYQINYNKSGSVINAKVHDDYNCEQKEASAYLPGISAFGYLFFCCWDGGDVLEPV